MANAENRFHDAIQCMNDTSFPVRHDHNLGEYYILVWLRQYRFVKIFKLFPQHNTKWNQAN